MSLAMLDVADQLPPEGGQGLRVGRVANSDPAAPGRRARHGSRPRRLAGVRRVTAPAAVSWAPPAGAFRFGAYIPPLGPAPGPTTTSVNGVVPCRGSSRADMGFEARWTSGGWEVIEVPSGPEAATPQRAPAALPPPGSGPPSHQVFNWLFRADPRGRRFAMARRVGVMYIIHNRHIWGSYRAAEGWRR
jgi:hypothetical protein